MESIGRFGTPAERASGGKLRPFLTWCSEFNSSGWQIPGKVSDAREAKARKRNSHEYGATISRPKILAKRKEHVYGSCTARGTGECDDGTHSTRLGDLVAERVLLAPILGSWRQYSSRIVFQSARKQDQLHPRRHT
jgi:hypothetical protein